MRDGEVRDYDGAQGCLGADYLQLAQQGEFGERRQRLQAGRLPSAEFREWLVAGKKVLRTSGQVVERLLAADTEELMQ